MTELIGKPLLRAEENEEEEQCGSNEGETGRGEAGDISHDAQVQVERCERDSGKGTCKGETTLWRSTTGSVVVELTWVPSPGYDASHLLRSLLI